MTAIISAVAVGLAIIASIVGGIIYNGKEDNVIEEASEMVIEHVTGVDIDLTPTSKER